MTAKQEDEVFSCFDMKKEHNPFTTKAKFI